MKKTMNHEAYQSAMKSKTPEQLRYIAKDAAEAAKAMPQGVNAGYYQDEVCYAGMELRRRGIA